MLDVRYRKRIFVLIALFVAVSLACALGTVGRVHTSAYADDTWDGTTAAGFASGTGTELDPFIVSTGAELAYFASCVNGGDDFFDKYVKLTDNIDLDDVTWTPIGTSTDVYDIDPETGDPVVVDLTIRYFNGTFFAENKTISNLSVPLSSGHRTAGLFGYVGEDGSVSGLTVDTALVYAVDSAGALVGHNEGVVENCSAENVTLRSIESEAVAAGGLIGICFGSLENGSVSTVDIDGTFYSVGGAAGIVDTSLEKCFVSGATLVGKSVGGVVGSNDGTISFAKYSGAIDVTIIESFGGIVADSNGDVSDAVFAPTTVSLTFSRVDPSDRVYVGGVVGRLDHAAASGCYAYDVAFGTADADYVGGIAGDNSGSITLSYAVGTLLGKTVGGVAGQNSGAIEKVLFVGKNGGGNLGINGSDLVGGIAAFSSGVVRNAVVFSNVVTLYSGGVPSVDLRGGIVGVGNAGDYCYYDGGAVYARDRVDYAVTVSDLTSTSLDLPADFTLVAGKLPALTRFASYSGTAVAGLTDLYATDMTAATTLSALRSATVDGDVIQTSSDLLIQLPEASYSGYAFLGWTDQTDDFDPYDLVASGTYLPVRSLLPISFVSQSADVDRAYDTTSSTLSASFSHELSMTYQWYYSADDTTYQSIPGATGSSYSVTAVSDSGYYYLRASVTDGVSTVACDNSADPICVSIGRGTYASVSHPAINGGTYSPTGTLSDFSLNAGFSWSYPTERPTCDKTLYDAVYNDGSGNYFDYPLTVTVTLEKASYVSITHPQIDFGRYTGGTIVSYGGLQEHFFWADEEEIPVVAWDNGEIVAKNYAAHYNADPTNYLDFDLNVSVMLIRAQYQDVSYGSALNGVYDPANTLADYGLNAGFTWADDSVIPDCAHNASGYAAIYCADAVNYEPYALTIYLVLSRAETTVTVSVEAGPYYEGEALPAIGVATSSTTGSVAWAANEGLILGENEYAYVFTPEDEVNYAPFNGVKILTAVPLAVTSIRLACDGVKTEYYAFEEFVSTGLRVFATYVNGEEREVYVYTLSYDSGNDVFLCNGSTEVVDGVTLYQDGITVSYDAFSETIDILVHRVFVESPVDEGVYRYDGTQQTISLSGSALYTIDGQKTATEVGEYTATANLVDGQNYYFGVETDPQTSCNVVWSILRGQVSAPQTSTDLVYSGDPISCGVPVSDYYTTSGTAVATDAGEYVVTVILFDKTRYEWADGSDADRQIPWTIAEMPVAYPVPAAAQYTYNGTEQNFLYTIENSSAVTVSGGKKTNAGISDVVFSFKNRNYVWALGGKENYVLSWDMARAPVDPPTRENLDYVYNGKEQFFDYSVQHASPSPRSGVDAGEYNVSFVLENANYRWSDDTPGDYVLLYVIQQKPVALPVAGQSVFTYDGLNKQFVYTVSEAEVSVTGYRAVDAGEYYATFSLKSDNYVWADESDADRILSWSILPCPIGVPTAASTTFTYDGSQKVLALSMSDACVVEGDRATAAGEYSARASLVNGNYVWADDGSSGVKYIPWVIEKVTVVKPVLAGETPVYNGGVITAAIPQDPSYTIAGNRQIDVGNYTASVNLLDRSNYVWTDGTTSTVEISWSISIRVIDLPTAPRSYVYTGEEIRLAADVSAVVLRTGDTETRVGNYTATFSLPDATNNVWADETTAPINIAWEIVPKRIEKPTVSDNSVYSPFGATAKIRSSDLYTIAGNQAAQAGDYTATVSLRDKRNYAWTDGTTTDLSLPWRILPAEVALPQKVSDLSYTGRAQTVSILVSDLVTVTGNVATEAGDYVAKVSLKDKYNYVWSDGTTDDKNIAWSVYAVYLKADEKTDLTGYVLGSPLPTPSKSGYVFGGWYLNADCTGEPVASLSEMGADTVLYAKWTESTEPDSTTVPSSGGKSGLSPMAIVGIVIAGVCVLIAVGLIVLGFRKKPRKTE